jgi:chemotaxis protein methyltransferase CheR
MKRPAFSFRTIRPICWKADCSLDYKACHSQTFESYLNFLRFDAYRDREVTELYTVITTNETYFFRDEAQLESFMKVMIPEVMKTNADTKQIRIWSAACSTGR